MSRKSAVRAPRLQLDIVDRARPRTSVAFVRRVVKAALAFGKRSDMPVALLLTNDAEIARLHARHLGDATPTDVMSFAVDGQAEIVVSVTTARRVAKQHGHALRAEVALYIVHGLLHVIGFDDVAPRARTRMRNAERVVMRELGLDVAPVDA